MKAIKRVLRNKQDDAGENNLYNRDGFPAEPFRTDTWKGITTDKKFTFD